MTSAGAENGAQFMGFRDCPVCGETLFAAERAEFVGVDRVVLHWSCDRCGHEFQTIADMRAEAAGARRLSGCGPGWTGDRDAPPCGGASRAD